MYYFFFSVVSTIENTMSNINYDSNPVTYHTIQNKKKAGEILTAVLISRALVHEAKIFKNFRHAEQLYEELETVLMEKRLFNKKYVYNSAEVSSYQRAIATMVRYAHSPEKSLEYATIFFQDKDEPFRTASKELVILTNLVYVYKCRGTTECMRTALELIKLGLAIGVYNIDPKHYEDPYSRHQSFNDCVRVFEAVIQSVLVYFRLEINSDKTDLVPQGSHS